MQNRSLKGISLSDRGSRSATFRSKRLKPW